jgi:hypothetical protein
MALIYPAPYQAISDRKEGELIIEIRRQEFVGAAPLQGQTEIVIQNSLFHKVVIINKEEIDFKDISVAFFGCYIGELKVEQIVSSNIHIAAYGSILSGKITSNKLLGVELNNCLLKNSIFLINLRKIRIAYTKENIQLNRWKGLLNSLTGLDYRTFLQGEQTYYVHDSIEIRYLSNFAQNAKKGLRLNLYVNYNQNISDNFTSVSKAQLNSLSITGSPSGKIEIESTKINRWYLYEFSPQGNISFYDIEPVPGAVDPKIGIHKCNLDKVWFDNVSFDQYSLISLYRTKFSQTIFTSCNFPEQYSIFERFMPIENVHYPTIRNRNDPKDMYEIFLQLKKSVESTGNYYEAQKMQAVAHQALEKIKSIPASDRVILWISRWSNNHGLSIKRPFLGLILCSAILYILYLWSIDRIFNRNEIDLNLIGYFFSFIDITHRSDFLVEKEQLNGCALAVDYLGKVVVGFFIYQFVAAFRKYGKK